VSVAALPPAPLVRHEQRWYEGGGSRRVKTLWVSCLDERCPLEPVRVPLALGRVVGMCWHDRREIPGVEPAAPARSWCAVDAQDWCDPHAQPGEVCRREAAAESRERGRVVEGGGHGPVPGQAAPGVGPVEHGDLGALMLPPPASLAAVCMDGGCPGHGEHPESEHEEV
jgi:hypothetical protein